MPTTYYKVWDPEADEYIWVPENELPLWYLDIPDTGDHSRPLLWVLLSAGSAAGLGALWLADFRRRRREP